MKVQISTWPGGRVAPVVLMVDDLTDGWIGAAGTEANLGPNDWGAMMDRSGSSVDFLQRKLLDRFPETRVTYFIPVDRAEDIRPSHHPFMFRPIDERPEFIDFLQRLDQSDRVEFAYHGTFHGRPGRTGSDYVPEFRTFATLRDATEQIERGKEIWRRVFGRNPVGGKYPAYDAGSVGEAAISETGFRWWCRNWDRGKTKPTSGTNFQPKSFGAADVIDIPSTVHGGILTLPSFKELSPRTWFGYIKGNFARIRPLLDELDSLLSTRSVVSVQEHITWTRPDVGRQTPNIYDDVHGLRLVFWWLNRRDIWNATCEEIANYANARNLLHVEMTDSSTFSVVPTTPSTHEELHAAVSLEFEARSTATSIALEHEGRTITHQLRGTERGTMATEPFLLETGHYRLVA